MIDALNTSFQQIQGPHQMNQEQLKQLVAEAARDEVLKLESGAILGVGTGSTATVSYTHLTLPTIYSV